MKRSGKRRHTCSTINVVQVASTILVRPITCLTVETRLSRTSAARVLDDHSFIQVLVKLEIMVSSFHELCRLR